MGKYAWVPTDTTLAEKKLEEKDKRIAKLEAERDLWANRAAGMLSMVPESTLCGEVRSGVADIRAEERELCLDRCDAVYRTEGAMRLFQLGALACIEAIRNLNNPSPGG